MKLGIIDGMLILTIVFIGLFVGSHKEKAIPDNLPEFLSVSMVIGWLIFLMLAWSDEHFGTSNTLANLTQYVPSY